MIIDKDDDEDEIIENEDEKDEDESEGSSKKKDDDKEIEVEIEIEEEEKKDERVAVQGKKPFKEETQEEKRARRRAERKQKNSRNYANRRELENIKEVLNRVVKENEELKGLAGEFGKREASRDEQQIQSSISAQNAIYRTAEEQFAKAIAEGDGVAAAAAQRTMNDAVSKHTQLTQLKNTAAANRQPTEVEKKTDIVVKDNKLQTMYTQRFLAQNDWFDPSGKDEDSKLAKEIDNEVAEEGYDPNTKEYWDEVKKRIRDEIPHVFEEKKSSAKPRPKQVNGSMGADSGSSTKKTIKIPERVVKMARDAGQWDDPKMRKLFINNWKQQNGVVS